MEATIKQMNYLKTLIDKTWDIEHPFNKELKRFFNEYIISSITASKMIDSLSRDIKRSNSMKKMGVAFVASNIPRPLEDFIDIYFNECDRIKKGLKRY